MVEGCEIYKAKTLLIGYIIRGEFKDKDSKLSIVFGLPQMIVA
jgi:hypothetical protein